jgi:diaminohydroxyphosphoribosylaminopyrimidine deaminase/5-amino-6-(5-phosphoribosylamino)uracil reductase
MQASDRLHMARALALARDTIGLASPNPQVGCVLVRDGVVLGEGAHLYDRFDHAEIVALKQAASRGHDVRGATAYVTLEPCSHYGRTGPCADALIAAGIARCVIATLDPNPQVSGRGIGTLRAAGIDVTLGTCQAEARSVNDAFACSIVLGRPFVTLKAALSTDGMLAPSAARRAAMRPPGAPPQPHWLTGPPARAEVQQLRHASDAILTGIGTVLADDPELTDRTGLPRRRPLLRVLLDPALRLPLTSKLVRSTRDDLLVVHGPRADADRRTALHKAGAELMEVPENDSGLDLFVLLAKLHQRKLLSFLLESGSALNAAFLSADLVDRALLFYAPVELGPEAIPFARGGSPTPFALALQMLHPSTRSVGDDIVVSGLLHDPWASLG